MTHPLTYLTAILADVPRYGPSSHGLPGMGTVQDLINGLGFLAAAAGLASIVSGGGLIGIGSLSQNPHVASLGKRGLAFGAVGLLITGAAQMIMEFFFRTGLHLH